MIDLGLVGALTLVSAYLSDQGKPELPPTQGRLGMTDLDLYQQICHGDPLGAMTFSQAVVEDPRRIEGLVLQRVIQPLVLALTKVENPHMNVSAIQSAMAHAYLERNHQMRRDSKSITAVQIAKANRDAWRMNSEILRVTWETNTPESVMLKTLISHNKRDIDRAFRESLTICKSAASDADSQAEVIAWQELEGVLQNMNEMIDRYVNPSSEVIDDQSIELPSGPEKMGQIEREDLFGAVSFDEAMGAEFEEYVVTGHRSPAIGLSQYRRMGGRVF